MSAFNGIGARFHGCPEIRRDGSHFVTKWFCLVFPIVPLGNGRIWPESRECRLMGMCSATTLRAEPSGLQLPHVAKMHGIHLAPRLSLVAVDCSTPGAGGFRKGVRIARLTRSHASMAPTALRRCGRA